MKDARYKEIMEVFGMPNSRSLLTALQQVANEVAQEIHKSYEKNNKKLEMDARKPSRCTCSRCTGLPSIEEYYGE